MIRGTTPTFSFEVDIDLTDWDTYVTIKQRKVLITHREPEITPTEDGCIASITLTQAETLQLSPGKAHAQIRLVDANGVATSTDIFDFSVSDILLEGEIPQEV